MVKTWLSSTLSQERFSNLTVIKTHKDRTEKLCLADVENEFADCNDDQKRNFGTFKESDFITVSR